MVRHLAVVLLAASLGAAGVLVAVAPPRSQTAPGPCPGLADVPVRLEGRTEGDRSHYVVAGLGGGPVPLPGLWVDLEGDDVGVRNIYEAYTAPPGATIRYHDVAGSGRTLDVGDRFVVEDPAEPPLRLIDGGGSTVGTRCGDAPAFMAPGPSCGYGEVAFVHTEEEGEDGKVRQVYRVARVHWGPFRVDEISYEFRTIREDDDRTPPDAGDLVGAAGGNGTIVYRDNLGGPGTLDVGDEIRVRAEEPFDLYLFRGEEFVGQHWVARACG